MSDFEDRLGWALGEGAEDAPGVAGLAAGARDRARRRRAWRLSVGGSVAVTVVAALVVPLVLLRGGPDATTVADAGDGWKTVSFERESYAPGPDTLTVLVDVPDTWGELPDSDDECGFYDYGASSDPCAEVDVVSVLTDGGNLDYAFGPGLRPASDYDYSISSAWIGHVSVGGVDVGVASDDYQVAMRVLASARLEGQAIPDLSGGVYVVGSDGIERPALPLDAAQGYGEQIGPRLGREEYAEAERLDATHWRAAATVGDKRIEVVAPTPALAEVIAGSARMVEPRGDGWQTVTYEGDPVNESGDTTLLIDLPAGWEPLSGPGCSDLVRYGDPALACGDAPAVRVFVEALLEYVGPGLSDEGESSSGLVVSGRYVVSAEGASYETIRRILASVRATGQEPPSATWRTEEPFVSTTVEVPDDGSVSVDFSQPFTPDVPSSRQSRQNGDGDWVAIVGIGQGTLLTITAPTQALADVVASTVREAD